MPASVPTSARFHLLAVALVALGIAHLSSAALGQGARQAQASGGVTELLEVDADSLPRLLRQRRGHILLINVWSTWCAPCVEELPMLVEVATRYRQLGLGLILISADPPPLRDAAAAFLGRHKVVPPAYLKVGSEDRFIRALHPDWSGTLPATLLIDRAGKVRSFWARPVSQKVLVSAIEALQSKVRKNR